MSTRFIPLAGPLGGGGHLGIFVCVSGPGGGGTTFFFVCVWPISKWTISDTSNGGHLKFCKKILTKSRSLVFKTK